MRGRRLREREGPIDDRPDLVTFVHRHQRFELGREDVDTVEEVAHVAAGDRLVVVHERHRAPAPLHADQPAECVEDVQGLSAGDGGEAERHDAPARAEELVAVCPGAPAHGVDGIGTTTVCRVGAR